jgi:acetyl-CoA acetyltransferase
MGGVRVDDIDIFCLYDPTSFEVIRQFEMMGLCDEGEGGRFVETGAIDLRGRFPVNPDGGTLAHSYIGTQQMTLRVIEVVRQLRGTAVNQLDAAEVGIATAAGSGAQHIELVVLGKG